MPGRRFGHDPERHPEGVHRARDVPLPAAPSLRLITDVFAHAASSLPALQHRLDRGYHIREAGATAAQEIAFTLADGIAYVEAATTRGLEVDRFAPRMSFFFNAHNDLFEEVAKFRAARRMWATMHAERFAPKDPKSLMLRFHTQTGRLDAHGGAVREQRRSG